MKTTLHFLPRASGSILGLFLLVLVGVGQAAERVVQTSTDLPFYARFERGLIHTDGEWAAIPFYRPPACVRTDFNLLDMFDVPAAFGCGDPAHPYLTGFGIWKDVPPGVPVLESGIPPIQSELKLAPGEMMPIWFVRWDVMSSLISDDVLTMEELWPLIGSDSVWVGAATFYTETLHPEAGPPGVPGGAQQTKTTIVASGFLLNGLRFTYQAMETKDILRNVKIEFK